MNATKKQSLKNDLEKAMLTAAQEQHTHCTTVAEYLVLHPVMNNMAPFEVYLHLFPALKDAVKHEGLAFAAVLQILEVQRSIITEAVNCALYKTGLHPVDHGTYRDGRPASFDVLCSSLFNLSVGPVPLESIGEAQYLSQRRAHNEISQFKLNR